MGAEKPPTPSPGSDSNAITLSSKQVLSAKMKVIKADGTEYEIVLKEPGDE